MKFSRLILPLFFTLTFSNATTATQPSSGTNSKQFHHPIKFVAELHKSKSPGKKVYKSYCAMCHDPKPMINLAAPKFRHVNDWKERLQQKKEVLFKHVTEGYNNMPARGGCFECSDEDLKAAVKYMLPNNENKTD